MKQIVFGVFLVGIFCFVALFGYTRQTAISVSQTPKSIFADADCRTLYQGRRAAIECHIQYSPKECVLFSGGACPTDTVQRVFVSRSVAEKFERQVKGVDIVRVRLRVLQQDNVRLFQIFVNGQPILPQKTKRE